MSYTNNNGNNIQTLEMLQDSEKRYRRLFESAKDGILILDADTGKVVDVNPFLMKLLGYSYDELFGKYIWEIGEFKDIAASKDAFKTLQDNEYIRYEDLPLETRDGHLKDVEFVSNVYLVDHTKVIQCNIRDITERRIAEKALMVSEERLRLAIQANKDGLWEWNILTNHEFFSPRWCEIIGYSFDDPELPHTFNSWEERIHPDDHEYVMCAMRDHLTKGVAYDINYRHRHKSGKYRWQNSRGQAFFDESGKPIKMVGCISDITERKALEDQFQQAQKMEAVGLLAGGVAHDFNNMLSLILGYTEIAMSKIKPDDPLYDNLEEIFKAATRSADITRQLLAFARKQTIIPVVLDLNKNVENMLKMLQRLIGENINLKWLPAKRLWPVKIDPVQVNQILANLCVNAKDAIANVGKITIETGNAIFDETYCSNYAGYIPGEYVMLAVSDNGCGIDKEILDQIFEPFFTSKEAGRGTGLGLSTVHGIVKQNKGFINVYSESERGTTFRIYLPRYAGQFIDAQLEKSAAAPRGRGETLLIVDDEPALLTMGKTMLKELGYRVITACTPNEAIHLASKHMNEISLLITDVIMPEMNGLEMSKKLKSFFPNIRILFMSGYTANVIVHWGVLNEGVNFIHKPFSMKDLAVKIRDAIDMKKN